ncbi:MAG: YciI family protein [Pseudomonadota bacterium]
MKYLCLAYYDERAFDTVSAAELEAIGRACRPHDEALRATGQLVAQASLGSTRSTACIRPRNGKPVVTDGPFAETKEQIGGFYMIEAKDLDEAIKLAAGIPPARVGSIEVRPIRPIRESVAAAARVRAP